MDEFGYTKALLGGLTERTLRLLHDAVRSVLNDSATSALDRVDLGRHLTQLAKLIAEKSKTP